MATIVRGPRAADHFTIISNSALRDERLSWKARGLLAYLLSMETGWQTSVRRLATVAPDGKSAVETALAELQDAGYLERVQTRGADDKPGTFSHTEYHVCDDAAVTGKSGDGDDEPTVTRFSVDGSSVPGESATKKNSPKKTSHQEDRSAARSAATASPVETSSSSITSGNASDRDDAAAATATSNTRASATRGTTPATILRAAGLDTAAAGRFRAWLVTGTGATNPDGLIVTLRNAGQLPERLSQWRASEDPTQVPGPGRVTHLTWCGDCDRATRTAVAHDAEGREYVRRCPVCNVNAASTTPGTSRAAHGPATAASDDDTARDAYEAARAARAALPAGVRRRRTTIGNVVDIATVRATQGSDQ